MTRVQIWGAILAERERQERLKADGRFRHTCADLEMGQSECLAVLLEEVGEIARCVLEARGLAHDRHEKQLHPELIQAAAVIVAWLEGDDKGGRRW